MAALKTQLGNQPIQVVNKPIPDLAGEFQRVYWEAVDNNLSPEDFTAKLVVLRKLSADMETSFLSLPEDKQNTFKPLLVRTLREVEELDQTQQRRAGRVAHVAQAALEDGEDERPRDVLGLLCSSPVFAIALGYLSHEPIQAATAAPQDMVDACTLGTVRMTQQRVSDARAEVRLLEETLLGSAEFKGKSDKDKEAILKNLEGISEIVKEETVRVSLNGESPASYNNFDYMKSRIRRRSFEHLQAIFAPFTPHAREEMAAELSRGLFILRPTIEQAIISPSMESVSDLIDKGHFALATITALNTYRGGDLDRNLQAIAKSLLPHMQLKEGKGQGAYPQIDLLVMILGRIKDSSSFKDVLEVIRTKFPKLYLTMSRDILALIRDAEPGFRFIRRDEMISTFLGFEECRIQEMDALIATLKILPKLDYHMESLVTFLPLPHHLNTLFELINRNCSGAVIPKDRMRILVINRLLGGPLGVNLVTTDFGKALSALADMDKPEAFLPEFIRLMGRRGFGTQAALLQLSDQITDPVKRQRLVQLFQTHFN